MMQEFSLETESNLYDVLEVTPDASPQEIRESYLRLKSAYNKDSVALYSLLSREETERVLKQIESAYKILSDTEKRKEYDQNHGFIEEPTDFFDRSKPKRDRKIISIHDEVKGGEADLSAGEEILEAPSTDYAEQNVIRMHSEPKPTPQAPSPTVATISSPDPQKSEDSWKGEQEWRGSTIRKIRESKDVSIEEISEFTKISKTYLRAIEEETFETLPAAVYLRGFLIQIAKRLELPEKPLLEAYLSRYRASCKDD